MALIINFHHYDPFPHPPTHVLQTRPVQARAVEMITHAVGADWLCAGVTRNVVSRYCTTIGWTGVAVFGL